MERKFKRLTIEKRAWIESLLWLKVSGSQIAREAGLSRSSLYSELTRGSLKQADSELRPYTRYFGDPERRVYKARRRNSHPPLKLAKAYAFIACAEKQMLENRLAPGTIYGMAGRSGRFAQRVCTKSSGHPGNSTGAFIRQMRTLARFSLILFMETRFPRSFPFRI